jgi:hypothetical protein
MFMPWFSPDVDVLPFPAGTQAPNIQLFSAWHSLGAPCPSQIEQRPGAQALPSFRGARSLQRVDGHHCLTELCSAVMHCFFAGLSKCWKPISLVF